MTPKANAPKSKPNVADAPEAVDAQDEQSQHQFPDPRENDLWDSIALYEAIWKQGEAEDPEAVDIGDV